jgi:hypothetical protein
MVGSWQLMAAGAQSSGSNPEAHDFQRRSILSCVVTVLNVFPRHSDSVFPLMTYCWHVVQVGCLAFM